MSSRRLTCTTAFAFAMAATAPGVAIAKPIYDPQPEPAAREPVTVIREVPVEDDETLALVASGAAVLVALGAAGLAAHGARAHRAA